MLRQALTLETSPGDISMRPALARLALTLVPLTAALSSPPRVLVICSPGSPGTTEQAQPTMDELARAIGAAQGAQAVPMSAVYYETAEAGLARLAGDDAAVAMVPLPFLIRYGDPLSLQPKLEAAQTSGPVTWSLVAKKGLVTGPASLAGWEL